MESLSTRGNARTELPPPARKRKRAGRIWARVLLALVLGLSTLIGAWFLGVRPDLHNRALLQVDRVWNQAETEVFQALSTVPRGPRNILMNERLLSNTLTDSNADAFQVWQVTVMPANISLSVTACGRNCTVIVVLEVGNNGQIQVTHVQVQGMLALIMSDDEGIS